MPLFKPLAAGLLVVVASSAIAQTEDRTVAFSGAEWTLRGDVTLAEHLGREALRFRNGAARLQGVAFGDGTIEYDVATAGDRSFVGVAFRIQPERDDYENFYLRPHQTGRFDAMQYTPVRNRVAAWQLYPEYNASYEIPRDSWLHVRLVIAGSRLEVYLGGAEEPAQVVEDLRLHEAVGEVSLLAFFPANQPEGYYPTAYSNVTVRPSQSRQPLRPTPALDGETDLIAAWSLSPAFRSEASQVDRLPDELLAAGESWSVVAADEQGRVNIAEHRAFPDGADTATVLARVTLHSQRARAVPLDFGFSDRVGIFLNGEPLYRGDNSYRSRSQRYLGVMTVDHDTLRLPLREGDNELVFAVSESFGGWGLVGRLPDREGVRVSAR